MDHGTSPVAAAQQQPGAGAGAAAVLLACGQTVTAGRALREAVPSLWSLSADELVSVLEAAQAHLAQVEAVRLAVIRELDQRGHHTASGATSTAAWLCHQLLVDRSAATTDVAAARALDPDADLAPGPGQPLRVARGAEVALAATGRALLAGEISRGHADAIRTSVTRLPVTRLSMSVVERDELLARAEQALLAECHRLTPQQVRVAGRHLQHLVDPDGVLADERRTTTESVFWIKADPDCGGYRYGGTTDAVTGAQLSTLIDAHSAPRAQVDPETGLVSPDPRTAQQRRGAAFSDVVRLAAGADPVVSGGLPTQLVVTVPLQTLEARLGERGVRCGTTETGDPLSAATIRRLACDAAVVPVVLGQQSEPLDVGRASRTIPTGLRRALNLRDGHCAFPSCTRPSRWADAHHVQHWADGGATSLDNLVLLCGHHHDVVHHTGWSVVVADGRPRFRPPMRT